MDLQIIVLVLLNLVFFIDGVLVGMLFEMWRRERERGRK